MLIWQGQLEFSITLYLSQLSPTVHHPSQITPTLWECAFRFLYKIYMYTSKYPVNGHLLTNDGRGQLKCDGTRAEIRFRLSAKRPSPFKSAGGGVQFGRPLAAEARASAVIMLITPCSEAV